MANPYESQSASNYNASPPPDDGSETTSNLITWAGIKTKLADPIKALADAINTAISTAFGKIWFNSTNSQSATYSLQATDQGKVIKCTNSITINLLAAATAGDGFAFAVFNAGTGTITLDGDGSETINGATTFALGAQYDTAQIICDGTGWIVVSSVPPAAGAGLTKTGNTLAVGEGTGIVVNGDDVAVRKATKTEMESETSNRVLTADIAKNHPGIAKAWVVFAGTSASPITKDAGYNISGTITKNSTGDYTATWSTAFANASYAVSFGGQRTTASDPLFITITSITASSLRFVTRQSGGTPEDYPIIHVTAHGTQ